MASQSTDAARARASSHAQRRSPNHSAAVRGCGGSRNSHRIKNPILDAADPAIETKQQNHALAATVVCRFYGTFGGKWNGGACARARAARDYEIRERKLLPLARLDLDETIRLNRERNVEFVIRSRDRSELGSWGSSASGHGN